MFSILPRIREVFPNFNVKPVLLEDFWRACKTEKFIVKELPLLVNGYYEQRRGKDYILINSHLNGDDWLFTALHEFCHALTDAPHHGEHFTLYHLQGTPQHDRRERFADAFAHICMMPLPVLTDLLETEVCCPILERRIQQRVQVMMVYGL